jgi:hypothetical protein
MESPTPLHRRTATLDPLPCTDATLAGAPESALRTLGEDEERLVVFCCTIAGSIHRELLDQVAAPRARAMRDAADGFSQLDRAGRLSTFSRLFTPTPDDAAIRRLAARLESEPAWFAALVCHSVPPQVRDRLLCSPAVRDAWRAPLSPQPAMVDLARRWAASCLADAAVPT